MALIESNRRIRIDGANFEMANASSDINEIVTQLQHIDCFILERRNLIAVMKRAKHAYLIDLREEIVRKKSGVDLSALLDGE